jgi:hypothetical protein
MILNCEQFGLVQIEIMDLKPGDGLTEKWKYAIAYCKRRLAANPAMATYVLKNILHKTTGKR